MNKQWVNKFRDSHGERLAFGVIATTFAVCFLIAGLAIADLKEAFVGAGTTILIGVATTAFNKMRSPKNNGNKPEEVTGNGNGVDEVQQ